MVRAFIALVIVGVSLIATDVNAYADEEFFVATKKTISPNGETMVTIVPSAKDNPEKIQIRVPKEVWDLVCPNESYVKMEVAKPETQYWRHPVTCELNLQS